MAALFGVYVLAFHVPYNVQVGMSDLRLIASWVCRRVVGGAPDRSSLGKTWLPTGTVRAVRVLSRSGTGLQRGLSMVRRRRCRSLGTACTDEGCRRDGCSDGNLCLHEDRQRARRRRAVL